MSADGKTFLPGPDTRITRRSLLLSLPAVAMAHKVLMAQGAGTLKIRALNHMTLSVSDPKRSLDFYQGLFGMPVHAHQGATTLLRVGDGPQFIAISAAGASGQVGINHYCVTIDDFNVDRVLKVLSPGDPRPGQLGLAFVSQGDQDLPPVLSIATTLHQLLLDQPVDDAGHRRQ